MALSEQTLKLNQRVVHYWESGDVSQLPILLLHGAIGNAWTQWAEVMPFLSEEYRLIAPDLPGYGQSDPLPDMRLESLIAWVEQLLIALEINEAVIIGNSFGALLGRLLAAQKPQRVPALVMCNGGVIPVVPPLARTLAQLPIIGRILFGRISKSTLAKSNLASVIQVQRVLTPQFYAQVQANKPGLRRLMQALTVSTIPPERVPAVPVLLLWGEEDSISPLVVAKHIQNEIPGAQLSPIAQTGHLPQVEAPEVFASQVTLFLRSLQRGRSPGDVKLLG
ncbi:MAG: alpha/beta hydrolase [Anaerolineae bacterium]|jgi:pimeloyl-ACP methyl ester carboxylesterase|nr:alpha/beta hydrolase [Anaerolineae bacterium]